MIPRGVRDKVQPVCHSRNAPPGAVDASRRALEATRGLSMPDTERLVGEHYRDISRGASLAKREFTMWPTVPE